ncbi:MAG: TonB-dependent receptor plug domain-containing protein [Bacteroidota bacterium]
MAQSEDGIALDQLKKLSFEELMDIEVTSISMRPEKLTEVASAVQVIKAEDIYRSGANRLPEALRLVSNLQVSQANSHDWAITSRGFNGLPSSGGLLANKLLVTIDGRSVYNPLFGGVYWGVQNVFIEDIDRIEVVSGPGGTLWGANAVNGVISIVSKSAKETQGLYASAGAGSFLNYFGNARYGFKLGPNLFCRVYGQHIDQDHTVLTTEKNAHDAWRTTQAGFRLDYYSSDVSSLTVQGDFYGGIENDSSRRNEVDGQNVIVRYSRDFSAYSNLNIRAYFDRMWRNTPYSASPYFYQLDTYDYDIQYRTPAGQRQSILVGIAYRMRKDNTSAASIVPQRRKMPLYSGFIQDEITIVPDRINFTIGSKFLHNVFSGYEYQPNARLAWTPDDRNTLWASLSRAVRIPSRFDSDITVTPVKFDSEKVVASELGYRARPFEKVLVSFAGFFNQYDQLRSIDSASNPSAVLANSQRAESWGLEVSGTYQANSSWRLRGGYSYFRKKIWAISPKVFPLSEAFEGVDPRNLFFIQSIMDLPRGLQFDVVARFVDELPPVSTSPAVPAYLSCDVRIAWLSERFEISIVGQNILEEEHTEVGSSKIPRSIYGRIACRL